MTRSAPSQRLAFLPEPLRQFLHRRLVEIGATVLFALAIALAVALASFDAADPSLNTASPHAAQNLLGTPGALVADLLLQTIGATAALVPILLVAWAWRIGSHRGLSHYVLRVVLVPFALVGATVLVAAIPLPAAWPLKAGAGGWIGDLLWREARAAAAMVDGLPAEPSVIVLALALAIPSLAVALGLAGAEWRAISRTPLAIAGALTWTARTVHRIGLWIAPEPPPAPAVRERAPAIRRDPYLGDEGETAEANPVRPALTATRDDGADPIAAPKVAKRSAKVEPGKRVAAEKQPTLDLVPGEYHLPPLSHLSAPEPRKGGENANDDALKQNARLLEAVLNDFGVRGAITQIQPGPVVTLYEFEPAPGVKTSRVIGLSDDIARSMSVVSVRGAVVPGKNVIGLEIPNAKRETVVLREMLASADYENTQSHLTLALGKTIAGEPVIADLARMPHLLIAGTTGSGKSVAINTMILSLLYRLSPQQCRLILIDPKMLELSVYEGIPHLLAPVVTDPGKAVVALKWVVREMETRYRAMSRLGVRNIAGYNERLAEAEAKGEVIKRTVQTGFDQQTGAPLFEEQMLDLQPMPFIVVIVDEMADLMIVAGKEIETAVQRLSQMARAAGIHIIMATQRPSVDVITGTIKANFPTRVSFQVTSKVDSRTILEEQGAEQLLGSGDMLFRQSGGRITRVHGPFVSDGEVERVVSYLKTQGVPQYVDAVTEEPDQPFGDEDAGGEADALYDQAVALVCRERKASTSFVQRHLQIGYNRAARIMERMEREGVVTQANHVGKREVLGRDIDALE